MSTKRKQVIDDDLKALDSQESSFSQPQEEESLTEITPDSLAEFDIQDKSAEEQKKIDEIEQTVSKRSGKKKKIWSWVFFFINIAVVAGILAYQLGTEEVQSPLGLNIQLVPLIVLVLFFVFSLFVDILPTAYLLKRNTGKWRLGLTYKATSICRYYDGVTPLSTGGQPFQISYMKSHDVPLHIAMSIPLTQYVVRQICWSILGIICLIVASFQHSYDLIVYITAIIGFILGSFMLVLIILLSVSKKTGKRVVIFVLKFLQKIKIVKNYEKQYEKIMKTIEDFQDVMRRFAKSPKDAIIMFGVVGFRLILSYFLPYFVFSTFNGFDGTVFVDFFISSVIVDFASSFCPLPGATGMSEVSFYAIFKRHFVGQGTLFWALLLWRFLSYYYYLLQGIVILSYDMFYGNRKRKWMQRKQMLLEESKIFKQEQINRFRAERKKRRNAQKFAGRK